MTLPHEDLFGELAVLTALNAPSGFEEPVLAHVRSRIAPFADEIRIDVRGNLYAIRNGAAEQAPTVMCIAHADEIGFMVTRVTGRGYLRFVKLGGPTDMVLPGREVRVLAENGPLAGIIGVRPGHVLSGDEVSRVPAVEDMYIDIGAESAADAVARGVEAGTPAVFTGPLAAMTTAPSLVYGKAVDDRAGILAMIKTAELLQDTAVHPTVVWCVSVEEETGLRGAAVAAGEIRPDVVIALDTAPAGGTPDVTADELPWEIGGGPLVKVRETRGLSTHGPLRRLIRSVAAREDIPYRTAVDTAGITDATSAQQADANIAAASICLPRKYSHSPVELLDLGDLAALVRLLAAVIPSIDDTGLLSRL